MFPPISNSSSDRLSSPQKLFWILLLASLMLFSLSCGSSSSNQNISAAQAQAISQQFVAALQGAFNSAASGFTGFTAAHDQPRDFAAALRHAAQPQQSSDCTTNSSGQSCNIPVSYTGPCPSGGDISVNGDFTLTLNNSGDGSSELSFTVTPVNCGVSNLTINGNPNVTVSTAIDLANDQLELPLTVTGKGGITYGPHPSGSCSLNVSLTVSGTETQPSCSVSGTVCGQSVSGSC